MQQLVKRSDIVITTDRQRKVFDPMKIQEMSNGIQAKGLLHAPVMRRQGDKIVLVAGETRIRAIDNLWMLGGQLRFNGELIPEGFIPYVTLGELTELEAQEAELEENIRRTDLTWQESSAALQKLHSIRSARAQAEGRIHTIADTAVEIKGRSEGSYQESVRKELIVAKHLSNPEVAKAKTVDEAFKVLKKQEAQQQNIARAQAVGTTFTAQVHKAFNVNCLEWMAGCDPESFDVILTDPPYGMGADTFGDGGDGRLTNNEHHYKDDIDTWRTLMAAWCPLSYRVAKPQAHAYVFCDIDNFHELKGMMQKAGWYVFRTPFVCTKPGSGRVPLPFEGPRRQYEILLYAIKGKKPITAIYPDVLSSTADANMTHGAQKPVELFEQLLLRSVRPGDMVLDSFAGSGTIIPAAHRFKCKAVALELNQEYFAMVLKRMEGLEGPDPVNAGTKEDGARMANELQSLMGG